MNQKSANNKPKISVNHPEATTQKSDNFDVTETPHKKHSSVNPHSFSSTLSSLFPPNNDHPHIEVSYPNAYELRLVQTPIVTEHSKFLPNEFEEGKASIIHKIIFESSGEDALGNSSQMESSDLEEETPNSQEPVSQEQQSEPSQSEEDDDHLEAPHQNGGSGVERQNKIRNRNSKSKSHGITSMELNPNKKVFCNCKKTKCLKLYCDCFRLNQTCEGCNCVGCHNLQIFNEQRNNAILALMDRNPDPFGLKIIEEKHAKGCNCKKSNCLKKYCQCYQAGLKCGENCKCEQCKNIVIEKGPQGGDRGASLSKNTAKKERKMVEM